MAGRPSIPGAGCQRHRCSPPASADTRRRLLSGDRVRWYADGELDWGGSISVKLRGAVELGEIEQAQPGVVEVVVVLVVPHVVWPINFDVL